MMSYYFNYYMINYSNVQGYSNKKIDTKTCDLVIKYARILDGTGEKDFFRGDIAIKDGIIVDVGNINNEDVLVFDAGGLTVIPVPVEIENTNVVMEHLLKNSYPRYPAHYIYFQNEPYKGLTLAQIAKKRGEKPERAFAYLKRKLPSTEKVYLFTQDVDEKKLQNGDHSLKELLAFLTGNLAQAQGLDDKGMIKEGCKADLCFFRSEEYDEESLKSLFLKGEIPPSITICEGGKIVNQ